MKFNSGCFVVNKLLAFFQVPSIVRLAIAPEVLATLVEKGELHASDFRCLDLRSKRIVWKMFLLLAMSKLGGNQNHSERH
jgi:hypothetical protein